MNNLLSYCELVDAKIRASDKDLPVTMLNLWTSTSIHYANDLFSYLQIAMEIQDVSYLIASLS